MKSTDNKSGTNRPISTRGRTFVGTVVSARAQKTATVQWERTKAVPKYERFLKLTTKIKVHNPEDINAQQGDIVKIAECRKLSKTKNFIIVEKLGRDIEYLAKKQLLKEAEEVIEAKARKKDEPEEENESS